MTTEKYNQYPLSEINADLMLFIQKMKNHDKIAEYFFTDAYYTGLRAMELAQLYARLYKLSSTWYVKLEKGSADRQIDLTTLTAHAQLCIELKQEPYWLITHNKIKKWFRDFYPKRAVYSGEKKVTAHLFRHAYVKRLYTAGIDIETIAAMIGEKKIENAQHYADSELYYVT